MSGQSGEGTVTDRLALALGTRADRPEVETAMRDGGKGGLSCDAPF
jgi:hypothetical protein